MFEHCDVKELSDKELEDKLQFLGRTLGIKAIQQKQRYGEMKKATTAWNNMCMDKATVNRDIETVCVEIEARQVKMAKK